MKDQWYEHPSRETLRSEKHADGANLGNARK